jgi:hypothetical protein
MRHSQCDSGPDQSLRITDPIESRGRSVANESPHLAARSAGLKMRSVNERPYTAGTPDSVATALGTSLAATRHPGPNSAGARDASNLGWFQARQHFRCGFVHDTRCLNGGRG